MLKYRIKRAPVITIPPARILEVTCLDNYRNLIKVDVGSMMHHQDMVIIYTDEQTTGARFYVDKVIEVLDYFEEYDEILIINMNAFKANIQPGDEVHIMGSTHSSNVQKKINES